MSAPTYARLYKPRMSVLWWLGRRSYTAFMLREISSVFVAWTVVYLLWMVNAVAEGPAQYQRFLDLVGSPWFVALNLLALAFLVYHTVTFINATPQATVVKPFGRKVPGRVLVASLFGVWLVVSAFLAWLVVVD